LLKFGLKIISWVSLQFPDEETLSDNTEFFDEMFDSGFRIEKTTKEEYDAYQGGDEITVEDIKNGNYRIDNIDDVD
jgi:hypothetical protein